MKALGVLATFIATGILVACSTAPTLKKEEGWHSYGGSIGAPTEADARRIASEYFNRELRLEGGIGRPQEEDTIWRIPTYVGYAARHSFDIVVRKIDGSYRVESVASEKKKPNQPPATVFKKQG